MKFKVITSALRQRIQKASKEEIAEFTSDVLLCIAERKLNEEELVSLLTHIQKRCNDLMPVSDS